jgi:Caspase domain
MREPPTVETTLAVVLGASEYPRKPAWTNPVLGASARAIRDYLRSPSGLAMRPAQLLDLFEAPDSPPDQLLQIAAFLNTTGARGRDLIVYYVGHGCFDHDDYCLGVRATERDKEFISTLESRKLARIIREGFARKRVYVILDSCFAASAARDWQGDEIAVAVRKMSQPLPREGTAFLAAASKYDVARAPRDARYTVFTGAVLDALTSGVERAQPRLSLHDVYEEVRDRLRSQVSDSDSNPELHAPSQQEGDVSRLALFPNPAFVRRVEAERARAEAKAHAARARAKEAETAAALVAARGKAEAERLRDDRDQRARAEPEAARVPAEQAGRAREAPAAARGKAEAERTAAAHEPRASQHAASLEEDAGAPALTLRSRAAENAADAKAQMATGNTGGPPASQMQNARLTRTQARSQRIGFREIELPVLVHLAKTLPRALGLGAMAWVITYSTYIVVQFAADGSVYLPHGEQGARYPDLVYSVAIQWATMVAFIFSGVAVYVFVMRRPPPRRVAMISLPRRPEARAAIYAVMTASAAWGMLFAVISFANEERARRGDVRWIESLLSISVIGALVVAVLVFQFLRGFLVARDRSATQRRGSADG